MSNQRDLALAYSPGVAVPCLEIQKDPLKAYDYTAKANLVAVISNGTAVLGLGNIGALAGKPVMEGKGCLFKKFAGIDVFDIEVDETDPDKLVEIIASLEPTFGGINLEDIKSPECFEVETRLRERMRIPVFHDDQHGTAIVAAAALLNGLEVVGKRIGTSSSSARAPAPPPSPASTSSSAWACARRTSGSPTARASSTRAAASTWTTRRPGTPRTPRPGRSATSSGVRTCSSASRPRACSSPRWSAAMADRPIILAMANPDPEIRPELAKEARPDCIIATGRSDYPNQVNNVLCFPFIFRARSTWAPRPSTRR
jgi:malate dehydrogenase (oxaloacetate-decarboxylating)(NADP+)